MPIGAEAVFMFAIYFSALTVLFKFGEIWFVIYASREILKETMDADEEYCREKWTLFGNEAEKVEVDVIRNQHELRTRIDKMALRKQVW